MKIRLQKFLSEAGVASRRKAELLIQKGTVHVNRDVAHLGMSIDPEKDIVTYNGKIVDTQKKVYIFLHKPKGYISTRRAFKNTKNVYELLPKEYRNTVWSVGRLDKDTEGLLLFTNDGELTQQITHPSYEHEKEYVIETFKPVTPQQLRLLKQGAAIGGEMYSVKKAFIQKNVLHIVLTEGKKRHIRILCGALDIPIKKLTRIRINKLILPDNLKVGSYIFIDKKQI